MAIENLTNKYWQFKNSPPLADAYIYTNNLVEKIQNLNPPFDSKLPYNLIMFKPTILRPDFNNIPIHNNALVKSIISNLGNYNIIFCDGSKVSNGTGCAIFIVNRNLCYKFRITDICSIFTAEAYAILQALEWVEKENANNSIIFSDSQSVLTALEKQNLSTFSNYMINLIRLKLYNFTKQNINIILSWVKGHAGIIGNDIVDIAAKEATSLEKIDRIYTIPDITSNFKKEIRKNWEKIWLEYKHKSNNHYFLIHPSLPNKIPHIQDYNVSRQYCIYVTRMKLNHGGFPSHLHKIGVLHSPLCSCDNSSVGDLNHLIFQCDNFHRYRNIFLQNIKSMGIYMPVNITMLLHLNDKKVLDEIVNFIRISQIKF